MKIAATNPTLKVASAIATMIFASRVPKSTNESAHGQRRAKNEKSSHDKVPLHVRVHVVRGVVRRAREYVRSSCVPWRLEKVKEREDENPDEIDEVPEEPGHLDAVGEVLRDSVCKGSRRPATKIGEHEHPANTCSPCNPVIGKYVAKKELCRGKNMLAYSTSALSTFATLSLKARRGQKVGRSLSGIGRIGVHRIHAISYSLMLSSSSASSFSRSPVISTRGCSPFAAGIVAPGTAHTSPALPS